jgi:hypothetical protein
LRLEEEEEEEEREAARTRDRMATTTRNKTNNNKEEVKKISMNKTKGRKSEQNTEQNKDNKPESVLVL